MSNLSQFFGGGGLKPKSINIGGLVQTEFSTSLAAIIPSVVTLSGSLSANTLSTVLSITGKGAISALALQSVDATSRTHRMKITLDGTVIFDSTSSPVTGAYIMLVIGRFTQNGAAPTGFLENPLFFDTSLLVEYASSLPETALTRFSYIYYTR